MLAIALLVLDSQFLAAQTGVVRGACEVPVLGDDVTLDPASFWSADRQVTIARQGAKDKPDFRIAGDIVELNAQIFSSLARGGGETLTNFRSLTIDAREIVVAMPILLGDDATIRLHGETVRFQFSGFIGFTVPPKAGEQRVEIRSRTLDLSDSSLTPFRFITQDWQLWPERMAWPRSADGPRRLLSIHVESIVPANLDDAVNHQLLHTEPLRYLHNKTLDHGRSSGYPPEVWQRGYDYRGGNTGLMSYHDLLARRLLWPDHSLAKLERLFARGPYQKEIRAFTERRVQEFSKLLEGRELPAAGVRQLNLLRRIADGVDAFGYGPYDVPMTAMESLLDNTGSRLKVLFGDEGTGGLVAAWDRVQIAALSGGEVDQDALSALDAEVGTLEAEQRAIVRAIGERQRRLSELADTVDAALAIANNREVELRAEFDAKQAELERLGKVPGQIKLVAVGFSAVFPAAAPVLMPASEALTTGASLVYAHNSGDEVDLALAAKTLQEVHQEHNGYRMQLEELQQSWNHVATSFDKASEYLSGNGDDKSSVKNFGDAAASYGKLADALYNSLRPAGRQDTIQLPDFAATDDGLKMRLAEVEKLRAEEATVRGEVANLERRYNEVGGRLLELAAARRELLALDLQNDEARGRQRELALFIRNRLLADLGRDFALLRRGTWYVTGRMPDIPDELLWFADDRQAASGLVQDPSESGALEASLRQERTELVAYASSFIELVRTQLVDFNTRFGWRPPVAIMFSASVGGNTGNSAYDQANREFLVTINRVLAELAATDDDATDLRRVAIRIPFELEPPAFSEPETLLGVVVERVEFEIGGAAADGRQIVFTVEHPRMGWIYHAGGCRKVEDATLRVTEFEDVIPRAPWSTEVPPLHHDWAMRLNTAETFASIMDAAYPFRAPYHLFIELPQRAAWPSPPRVSRIDIQFVKTGPR
jgi:hypothetical protein